MAADAYGALLDALRGVTWPARRAALAGTAGTHRSRLRGLSAEFTEYRPYRQGDDPRRLDWKLLARTDRAFLRITNDRATLATMIVVDASASMAFPAESLAKWRQACRLAVGLAAVAHGSGDPVGLQLSGERGAGRVEAKTRRGIVAQVARALDMSTPTLTSDNSPLSPRLSILRGTPRIVIISDFLGDAEPMLREARTLIAGGTEVHAVHVVAREELEPGARAILATDPEDALMRRALVEETVGPYQQAFAAWRLATARAWRKAGAVVTEVVDDEASARAIRRITAPAVGDVGA